MRPVATVKASPKLRLTGIVFAFVAVASAQSLIEAGDTAAARSAFDSARNAGRLLCEFKTELPAMTYALQFQTGFVVDIRLKELAGSDHDLDIYLRVTPDGQEPVYLAMSGSIRNVEGTKGDAEITGHFVVGEGSYGVEALVQDDVPRACYSQWRIQAKPTGSERNLKTVTPAGAVQEVGPASPPPAPARGAPEIERLTVLVHATATHPTAAQMDPATVADLSNSLYSLLIQLPAKAVRLVVFTLDKQVVLLNKDPFYGHDVEAVVQAMEQLELAVVDVRALDRRAKVDVLSDLLVKEMRNPQPASAVIIMGPRNFQPTDRSFEKEIHPGGTPWFYLEYAPVRLWEQMASGPGGVSIGGRIPRGGVPTASPVVTEPRSDGIERLVGAMNGTILPVWSPHHFADAIMRMALEIPKMKQPLDTAAGEPPPEPPVPPIDEDGELVEPTGDEDPVQVMATLRDHLLARAASVPNHTCVETVQRDRYQLHTTQLIRSCDNLLAARKLPNHRLSLDSTDWLRLDVGLAVDREMFSWVGAAGFVEGELDKWIPEGAFGTGPFAAMLFSFLGNRTPRFTLDGETMLDKRRVLQYTFRVSRDESHYRIRAGKEWVLTGYAGTLLVDPRTSDLVRFRVRTDRLPADTHSCQIVTTLDYNMVDLGGFEYLLPTSSRQRFVGVDGSESENKVTFTSCREFRGESTLSFGNRPTGARDPAGTPTVESLPHGLLLTVELTSKFTLGKAAAGDPIEGRLVEPLRDAASGAVLATAGAVLRGRLTRVELRYAGDTEYIVALRWESLEREGAKTPLYLKPQRQIVTVQPDSRRALRWRGTTFELPRQVGERDVIYRFPGKLGAVESGLRTEWVITAGQ